MYNSFVNSMGVASSSGTRFKRYAAYGLGLLASASGCGPAVVDVGNLPATGDAGGSSPSTSTCAIPDLGQYRLVFDSDAGKLERRIYSMRADGSEVEPLTPLGELAREPAVSPDGTQLAYTTPEGIKLLDLATGQSELLVAAAQQPSWSPDGSRLIYLLEDDSVLGGEGGRNLIMNVVERTEEDPTLRCPSPEFTPDDTMVTCASAAPSPEQGGDVIFSVSATSSLNQERSSRTLVPQSPIRMTHPTLSLDGTWVATAFECAGTDHSSLWVSPFSVPTPACEGRRVTHADAVTATNPKWGPGVLIAYERGGPPRDIAIVAADTGDECVIEQVGDDRNPSWAPDVFNSPQ